MNTALTLAGGILAASTIGASAMPHCGERETVTASLSEKYSEHHVASGLQSETGLLEIWASETDATWTILMTRPDGQTCVVASGTHWLAQDAMTIAKGDPA